MKVFYCDHHEVPLPEGHRFPMPKYRLLREALQARGVLAAHELHAAAPASAEEVRRVHDDAYVDGVLAGTLSPSKQRRIGFPWSEALVRRSLASVQGTILAGRAALEDGIAGNLAGGTHHASRDAGAGYCVWNDIAIAARHLQASRLARQVLVVDLDVHQGDGTASIFAGDPTVFTLSLHGEHNFPFRKAQSDLDVSLADGTGDEAYLGALLPALAEAFRRARPDVVFYQAGVDPLGGDLLGRLALTHGGLRARDAAVLEAAMAHGAPVVLTLGGGYARPIEASVDAHVGTYEVVRRLHGRCEVEEAWQV